MYKKQQVKKGLEYFKVFLCAFIPRVVISIQAEPLRTLSDELSTLNAGAMAAGLDWNAVVSKAGYYGYGISFLMGIVFKISSNPIVIYRTCLAFAGVLQSLTAVIAYYLLEKVMEVEKVFAGLMAVAVSFMVVTRTTVFYNEHGLILATWLLILIMVKLVCVKPEDKKSQVIWTIMLSLCLGFTLMLHTRAILYILVCVFTIVWYWFLYKKCLISIPVFAIGTVGMVEISKAFTKIYQNRMWGTGAKIPNSSVNLHGVSISMFEKKETWEACLSIIFGQINTALIVSCGLLMLAFVTWIYFAYKAVFQRIKFRNVDDTLLSTQIIVLIGTFCFSGMAATIVGQSLSWLNSVILAMQCGTGKNVYAIKALTYVRYMGPFLGGAVLVAFLGLYFKKEEFKNLYKWTVGFLVFLQGIWITFILPYCYACLNATEAYRCYSFAKVGESGVRVFLPATAVLAIISLVMLVLLKKDNIRGIIIISMVIFVYQYCYNGYCDLTVQQQNQSYTNASVKLIQNIRKDGVEILPKDIYVVDEEVKDDHQMYYQYQFYFNNHHIIPEYPVKEKKEAILFTNSCDIKNQNIKKKYFCVQLDENEYLWVHGNELWKKLEPYIEKVVEQEHEIPLSSVYDAKGNLGEKNGITNDGNAGVFASSNFIELAQGEYEIELMFRCEENTKGEQVMAEILSEDNEKILATGTLDGSELKKDGMGTIKINLNNWQNQKVQIQCQGVEGVKVQLKKICSKRVSIIDYVGKDSEEEIESLKEILQPFDSNYEISMITDLNVDGKFMNFKYLEKGLQRKVAYINWKKMLQDKSENPLVLMRNQDGSSLIYQLLDDYIVIGKTEQFTLLASKKFKDKIEENNLRVYSSDNGLDMDYYLVTKEGTISYSNNILIPYGVYEMTVQGYVRTVDEKGVGLLYQNLNQTEMTELLQADSETLDYKKEIRVFGFQGLHKSTLRLDVYAGTRLENQKIYLKQKSDRNIIQIQGLLLLGDAEYEENGSVRLGKEAGIKVFGPYVRATSGKYKAVFRFKQDSKQKGTIGNVDVSYSTKVINEAEIRGEDFKNGRANIAVEFELSPGRTEPLLEFRTSINGEDPGLVLLGIDVEMVE